MSEKAPPLATLVRAGDAQTEAVAITPFVFMARDISNAYLVTTGDGDVMVNTGFFDDAHQQRNLALLAPHRTGPLRRIVLTQSHADHFGGVPVFREPETKVIGGPGFNQAWGDMNRLQPFFGPRSGKPRLVWNTLGSLEKLKALGGEIIVTGHGEPILGAERIRTDIDRMIGAIAWVRDYTIDGMNAGRTVHELMRTAELPEHLKIGEFHGKVSWAVKTIWDEYAGWFHCEDGTTELYGVPRSAVHADLVELAGADALATRAQARLDDGAPLEAIHLTDIVLSVEPAHRQALTVKRAAHEALLAASGATNHSETMWLRSEIAKAEARLAEG